MSLVSALLEAQNILVCSEEFWLHLLLMTGWVVFFPVVHQVGLTRLPEEVELVLVDTAVMKPMESHVHGFCSFGLDTTVDDAFGSAVVSLDECRGFGMSQFLQYVANFNCFA